MKLPQFMLNKRNFGLVIISFKGWILTFGFLIFTVYNYIQIISYTNAASDILIYISPRTLIFTALFSVFYFITSAGS